MKQFLTFLTLCMSLANVMAQDVSPLIKQYLLDNHKALHLSKTEATSDWHLSDQYLTKHNQVTQAYVQQQVNGLNLYNAISAAAVKNGSVVVFNSGFHPMPRSAPTLPLECSSGAHDKRLSRLPSC
jgi:hypothetical protein